MAREGNGRGDTVLHADAASLARGSGSGGDRHVGVLADHTVQTWQRTLDDECDATRDRHVVKLGGALRSGTESRGAVQTRPMGPNLDVTVVDEPTSDAVTHALDVALDGSDGGVVAVDDLSFLLDGDGSGERLEEFLDHAEEVAGEIHVRLPDQPRAVTTLARRFDPADERCRRWIAETGVTQLRDEDPTNFGYLRSHWREARRGLEAVEMAYPQSKQIHEAIPDPETTPRTLGAALQAFVEMGALGVWGDTVAANRYDMRGYDPEMVAAVGRAVEEIHAD